MEGTTIKSVLLQAVYQSKIVWTLKGNSLIRRFVSYCWSSLRGKNSTGKNSTGKNGTDKNAW